MRISSVIDDLSFMPEAFRGDATKFLLHSLMSAFTVEQANVAVIDNLAYLTKTAGRGTAAVSLIKNLRQFARANGHSILILANTVRRPPNRPLTLDDLAGSSTLAHLADSVFAIGRIPQDSSCRYIKHLKSRNAPPTLTEDNVAICRIVRTESNHNPPPVSEDVPAASADEAVGASALIPLCELHDPHSENSSIPQSAIHNPQSNPFIAFDFLGLCPESDILADPNARARTALTPQQALRAARNRELIDFLTSPQYARYLNK